MLDADLDIFKTNGSGHSPPQPLHWVVSVSFFYMFTLVKNLKSRLFRFLKGLNVPEEKAHHLTEKIIQAYSSASRHYHGLGHLEYCLNELDQLPQTLRVNRQSVELAIWYHDLVYAPEREDNEKRSALCFLEDLTDDLNPELLDKVTKMILASGHHEGVIETDLDLEFFLDIDRSILGRSEEEFMNYERAIQEEYKDLPRAVFYSLRKRFLSDLLIRPIFRTRLFYKKYEAQARENISRLLEKTPYSSTQLTL